MCILLRRAHLLEGAFDIDAHEQFARRSDSDDRTGTVGGLVGTCRNRREDERGAGGIHWPYY